MPARDGRKNRSHCRQMKNTGRILALDISPDKLEIHRPEMSRLGISIVETRVHDLSRPLETDWIGKYDRVLLDAPCSGLGVLRRNPDIKWRASLDRTGALPGPADRFSGSAFRNLSDLPVFWSMRSAAWSPKKMKPWCRVFACVIRNLRLKTALLELPLQIRSLMSPEGYLRTFPHLHDMDGFFAVRFRRSA